MKVEIWSDIMCPFCYIGKKNFEQALASQPFKDQVRVVWKSFQLDPSLPEEGIDISAAAYLEKNKGYSRQQIEGMQAHLKEAGLKAGIDFRQDISVAVNTFRAHRLIHFAQAKGKANDMEEALFRAHFTEGKNVGDKAVLASLSEGIGLNKNEVIEFLDSGEQTETVLADIAEAREFGISGVPFFVFNRKYAVSGAQPVETFVNALKQSFLEKAT